MENTQTINPAELINKSVTEGDQAHYEGNGVIRYFMPMNYGGSAVDSVGALPPVLPPFWSYERDRILRNTVYKESMWSASIGIAISKIAASAWEITSETGLRARRGQDLLLNADGQNIGWTQFVAKNLRDYLTTDNGSFAEIVRAGPGKFSRPIGLRHLDSRRCIRTGDPDTPVVYRDRKGQWHGLKWWQVIAMSDNPEPSDFYYGVGLCAASRAYTQIYKLAGMDWYMNEKITGQRPLAIYIVNGVLDKQMKNAIGAAKEGVNARGLTTYMGAVIMGIPQGETPGLVTIPLAELPDGFDRKEEVDLGILNYANAIGLDPQDLQPLTSSQLGTGTQSQVLHEKAKGRGMITWKQQWTHAVNQLLLPAATTFVFIENDLDDRMKKAEIADTFTKASVERAKTGLTTVQQEVAVLIDEKVLPPEYQDTDLTPTVTLGDGKKPVGKHVENAQAVQSDQLQEAVTDKLADQKAPEGVTEERVKSIPEDVPECVVCGKPVFAGFHVIYKETSGHACNLHESEQILRLKEYEYVEPVVPLYEREYENARKLYQHISAGD